MPPTEVALLTIVIPVKEAPKIIHDFIVGNQEILKKHPVIVVDSGGGEQLREYAKLYIQKDVLWWLARKEAYQYVDSKYTLNLDSDTILPKSYVHEALELLQASNDVAAVALDYEQPQGHYAYGTSVCRTELLKEDYDWSYPTAGCCECLHMFRKFQQRGMTVKTLPYPAKHLK